MSKHFYFSLWFGWVFAYCFINVGQVRHRCDAHCALNCDLSSQTPLTAARRGPNGHMMPLGGSARIQLQRWFILPLVLQFWCY